MKSIPQIQKYMTKTPYAINSEGTVDEAAKLMEKHGIRHLPVVFVEGEKYGVVTDRDVKYAMSLAGFDARQVKVKDICEEAPYITQPMALLSDVSGEMAERKLGSALIMDNKHLVGIFTTTDACRALNDLCVTRLSHS